MGYIFILLLQKNKYYIGMCNHPNQIQDYFKGRGPRWLIKYKPLKIVEVISPCDIFDIDKHTKRYMARFGLNNVRGGAYTSMNLSRNDKSHIDKEIFTALGMCMYCGSENHVSSECIHNNFGGQIKQLVHSFKGKCINIKNCISEKIQPLMNKFNKNNNNNNSRYNKKYDTITLNDSETKPMMYIDSPHRTREVEDHYSCSESNSPLFFQSSSPSLEHSPLPQYHSSLLLPPSPPKYFLDKKDKTDRKPSSLLTDPIDPKAVYLSNSPSSSISPILSPPSTSPLESPKAMVNSTDILGLSFDSILNLNKKKEKPLVPLLTPPPPSNPLESPPHLSTILEKVDNENHPLVTL